MFVCESTPHFADEPDPNGWQYHPADLRYHPTQTVCVSNLVGGLFSEFWPLPPADLADPYQLSQDYQPFLGGDAESPLARYPDYPVPCLSVQYQSLRTAFVLAVLT